MHQRDLYRSVKFYLTYKMLTSVMSKLSWAHDVVLIDIGDAQIRNFYEHQAVILSWSVRELRRQIKAQLYQNTPQKNIQAVFQNKLPAVEPQLVFKETYDFKFIELCSDPDEKELQKKILADLITCLKELGEDFCIRGYTWPIARPSTSTTSCPTRRNGSASRMS